MRYFSTGATRDVDDNKLDFEGFLDPDVIQRYGEFMHIKRYQEDGNLVFIEFLKRALTILKLKIWLSST